MNYQDNQLKGEYQLDSIQYNFWVYFPEGTVKGATPTLFSKSLRKK